MQGSSSLGGTERRRAEERFRKALVCESPQKAAAWIQTLYLHSSQRQGEWAAWCSAELSCCLSPPRLPTTKDGKSIATI